MRAATLATLWTIALLLFAGASTADALHDPRFARADMVATAYWRAAPDCSADKLVWQSMEFEDGVLARGELGGCVRFINPGLLVLMEWPEFCDVAVHEFGHLLGFGHTGEANAPTPEQDPAGVMNPSGARVPGCHTSRPDGRTRSKRRAKDRRWCAKHANICSVKYPNLAAAVL